jgi:hypothetical protein
MILVLQIALAVALAPFVLNLLLNILEILAMCIMGSLGFLIEYWYFPLTAFVLYGISLGPVQ